MIVILDEAPAAGNGESRQTRLSDFIGKATGSFTSAAEADRYVRELRDEWDKRS